MGETSWVVLASVVRPQGRRGEVLAELLTDFPESLLHRRLFLKHGASEQLIREVKLEGYWLHKGRVVLKLDGVDSMNDAEALRGVDVAVPLAERMPLTDDAVYVSDLIGAKIVDVSREFAREAGEIIDVLPAEAGPSMLVVRTLSTEPVFIPFVKAYLRRIDLREKRIEMDLPEGLLSVDAPLTNEERQRVRNDRREKV